MNAFDLSAGMLRLTADCMRAWAGLFELQADVLARMARRQPAEVIELASRRAPPAA